LERQRDQSFLKYTHSAGDLLVLLTVLMITVQEMKIYSARSLLNLKMYIKLHKKH